MNAGELIKILETMPKKANVWHLWDGGLRTEIDVVYLSKGGAVVTAGYDEVCYENNSRPVGSPSRDEDPYWHTPKKPIK